MKTKLLVSIFLLVICELKSNAQATFQKAYGGSGIDDAFCIQQTSDGGFIVTGQTSSIGAGGGDIFLLKTNAAGDTVFTKSFGGSADESANSVQQTTDGGFIVCGSSNSFSGNGNYDVCLIKTNSLGDTLWTKTYGGTDEDYGQSVKQTTDGGYIVTGIKKRPGVQDEDVYLIKTISNGDTLWTKTYGTTGTDDDGYAVCQTTDGGYIIAGTFGYGFANAHTCLIKTNAVGDTLWTKIYVGTTTVDYGISVQQTTDGGYIAGAQTLMGAGVWDELLIKTDDVGSMQWSKIYGGTGAEYLYAVQQTTDGGYMLGGSTNSFGNGDYDMYLIKTNGTGDTLWTKTYGGTSEDRGYYGVQTVDGGFAMGGYSVGFGVGSVNLYLVKTDSNGNTECNQHGTSTIVANASLQLGSIAIVVANPSVAVGHLASVTHNGATVTVLCTGSGTEEINPEDNSINIFPNPADDEVVCNIQSDFKNTRLKIYDMIGKEIFSSTVTTQNCKLETQNYLDGIYFVQLITDKKTVTQKLIVSH